MATTITTQGSLRFNSVSTTRVATTTTGVLKREMAKIESIGNSQESAATASTAALPVPTDSPIFGDQGSVNDTASQEELQQQQREQMQAILRSMDPAAVTAIIQQQQAAAAAAAMQDRVKAEVRANSNSSKRNSPEPKSRPSKGAVRSSGRRDEPMHEWDKAWEE